MGTITEKLMYYFRRITQDGVLAIGLLVSVFFLFAFVIYPLLNILATSFSPKALPLFGYLLGQGETQKVILNTLWIGVAVATIGTCLGFLMAYLQVRVDIPMKKVFHIVAIIPIISPPFAVAMSTITLFGRSGLITKQLLGIRYDIYGADGMIFALTISFIPFAYLSLLGMLKALDPAMDEAASDMGASGFRIFRNITLPLLVPGFASAFLLLFVSAIADLGNPLLLGGNMTVLASRIYLAIVGEYNLEAGAVLSIFLLMPSLLIFFVQHYWISRHSFTTVTGNPTGRIRLITTPWVKALFFAGALLFSAVILLVYGNIFFGALTKVWGINLTPTLEHFRFVLLGYGFEAMKDTIVLAAAATPLASLMGLLIAFLINRREFPGRSLIDFSSVLGLAVPGTIVGIALILTYNTPLLGGLVPKLTGTAFIIVMAFTVRSIPAAVRSGSAAMKQIHRSMEEASKGLGASSATTFKRITIPLIRPAVFAGLVWAFARSMTSLSPIIFLVTPEWRIMTAQILNEAETGRFGNAAAYSVVLIFIVLSAIGFLRFTAGGSTGAERGMVGS